MRIYGWIENSLHLYQLLLPSLIDRCSWIAYKQTKNILIELNGVMLEFICHDVPSFSRNYLALWHYRIKHLKDGPSEGYILLSQRVRIFCGFANWNKHFNFIGCWIVQQLSNWWFFQVHSKLWAFQKLHFRQLAWISIWDW